MANDDPRVRREQSRLGRIVNRLDNALIVAGAALTFSRENIRKAREITRSGAMPTKSAPQQAAVRLQAKQAPAPRQPYLAARSVSRVDTGKPRPSRGAEMER